MNDANEPKNSLRQQLILILDQYLNERERTILLLRLGLIDGVVHTLQEIGEMFSISRERVRQIEARAKQKLKQNLQQHRPKDIVFKTEDHCNSCINFDLNVCDLAIREAKTEVLKSLMQLRRPRKKILTKFILEDKE